MRCSARRRIRWQVYGDTLGGAMTEASGRVHPPSCAVWGGIGIEVGEGRILGDWGLGSVLRSSARVIVATGNGCEWGNW